MIVPFGVLDYLHGFLDIDSRRNVEKALGWSFVRRPLPKSRLEKDVAACKLESCYIGRYSPINFDIIIRINENKGYSIEVDIDNVWEKDADGKYRIRRGGAGRRFDTESFRQEEYLQYGHGWTSCQLSVWTQKHIGMPERRKNGSRNFSHFFREDILVREFDDEGDYPQDYRVFAYTIDICPETLQPCRTRCSNC